MIRPHRLHRSSQEGTALAITVVLMVALLGFLGVAIYTGLNAYLQNELQKAVTTAAMAGATAMYDQMTNGTTPLKSTASAQGAAQSTFNNIVASNPALQGFGAQLINGTPRVNAATDTVTINGRVRIPTAFLSLIGINEFAVDAIAISRYARQDFANPVTINTATGPWDSRVVLSLPLADGPGPDLYVESLADTTTGTNLYHGYMVEACTPTACYDISRAAKAEPLAGMAIDRPYPAGPRRVLFGNFYIDLAATGALGYNRNVRKATFIRVVDDGIADLYSTDGVASLIEAAPTPNVLSRVRVFHHAVACSSELMCKAPTGFAFGVQ